MKRVHIILLALISILAFNCQQEIKIDLNNPGNPTAPAPITATLQGNIIDENDQPAMGVTVKVGSKSAITDAKGYFRIPGAALDKNLSLVTAEKSGYFTAYRTFSATSGVNYVAIKLIPQQLSGTITSSSGGEVTLTNGAKISLPADAVVKSGGSSYSGTINVFAALIDPTANDITLTIPGSFTGQNTNGSRGVLTSYGMIAVELRSTAGEKLQIKTGSSATLTMPIPATMAATAPATIPLWYIDEQTGLWKEEGSASKNGNNYVGQVKHFSFWNCDAFNNAVLISMTLRTNENIPVVHAQVKLTRPNGNFSYGWTDSLGQVSGYVPSNEVLNMKVMSPYPCTDIIHSQNIGPFTQNTNLGVIIVNAASSPSLITISGRLLNCSAVPVTNGVALITYNNTVRYAAVNSSGVFTTTLLICSSGPSTCEIVGIDNGAQQQGPLTPITLVSPTTNAGDISACGTSAIQFINFNLDGTNYSINTSTPGDSITSNTVDSTTSVYVYMNGFRASPATNITLSYSAPSATPGTYPIGFMYVQNMLAQFTGSSNVVVTTFPTVVGGYHEGTFSAQFVDAQNPGPTHTITGSYRIRRQ